MSQKKVLNVLESLEFDQLDARVYIFLGKNGAQRVRDIVKALGIPKQKVYLILKRLQSKGIVTSTLEHPARFSATQFEKVLDLFVKAKMDEAQRIQQSKKEILAHWQSIAITKLEDQNIQFTVLEGRNYIQSKLHQMIEETQNQLSIVSTVPNIVQAEKFSLIENALKFANKSKVHLRVLTELNEQNLSAVKLLLRKNGRFEAKTLELGLKPFSRLVIRDEEEAIFFINSTTENFAEKNDEACLWTNCKSLVDSFIVAFENLWKESTDASKKINEIETGKPTAKTIILANDDRAIKKYLETFDSAEKEILIMTSSQGLIDSCRNNSLKEKAKQGVSVKILAPVTSLNANATATFLECCEIRHISTSYPEVTIIDGKHVFQFKNPKPQNNKVKASNFENVVYTNDAEYAEKTRNMFNDIWKNSQVPSKLSLDTVDKQTSSCFAEEGQIQPLFNLLKKMSYVTIAEPELSKTLTEKDVLNKVINAHKNATSKGNLEFHSFASSGIAVVRINDCNEIPNALIRAWHFDKQSAFGEGDVLMIHLFLETNKGEAFVPVALVHDQPETHEGWKKWMSGTLAAQNVQLVKKDQVRVQTYGKTLIAGWTNVIPLVPKYIVLPPSTITLEGYGNVVTGSFTQIFPSGIHSRVEFNGFEAFTTFIHGKTKYSAPGTEGFIFRETLLGKPQGKEEKRITDQSL